MTPNTEYKVILFEDGINANKQAEDYSKKEFFVNNHSSIALHLASGGGFAMKIEPRFDLQDKITTIPSDRNIPDFYKKYIATIKTLL